MSESPSYYLRFVPISLVEEYMALGWLPDGRGPLHSPHGNYAVALEWIGVGNPPEPPKRNPDETTPSVAEVA